MNFITPQGEEEVGNELITIYKLIENGKGEELAKIVNKNPFLVYQVVELITERIFVSPDQPQERLIYCFYILKELVEEYGIPVILLFNNMDAAMKLHEVALKGLKPQVSAFLVPCLETFSFDPDKVTITYLADLWIQLNPTTNAFPTKDLPKNAFIDFFVKVQKVLEACQDPINGSEADKKQLQGEVQKLLSTEDFESKEFNELEKELAIYYLNELLAARDRLEPAGSRKASVEEEKIGEDHHSNVAKSPAQEKKVVEKEESKSPAIKKSKEEEGHLARFKTSFVLNERVYEDEGKTTEYKNYRYPFENQGFGGVGAGIDQQNLDPRQVLQKTICAFLNRRGGRIYLGIHDNKTVRGLHLTPKQRDDLKLDIQSWIKNFEPDIINSEAVSIVFIPVKQSEMAKPIPGLFVVKIIVKQGDPSQLYSVQKRLLECYIRNDARVDLLSARETSDHIRKRDRNPERAIPDEEFEDPKPELLVDNFDKNYIENMNNSKVRFDKALKHGPGAGKFNQNHQYNIQKGGQQQSQDNLLQQFQQNLKVQQQPQNMGFVQKLQAQKEQQQHKAVLFGQQQQQNNKAAGGAFGHNFSNNNQQQVFGGKNNPHHQHYQNHNQYQGKIKFGNNGPGNWKEKMGFKPDQEIFEVFIDGLPAEMSQKEFETLICKSNSFNVINPRKIRTKQGIVKGYANFMSLEEAEKFISLYHGTKVGSSYLDVDFNFAS